MSDDQRGRPGPLLGRPFGIPVYLTWSWFLFAAFVAWAFSGLVATRFPDLGGFTVAVAVSFAVLLGLSVLVHELAHSVLALRFGLPVRRITLYLLGGVSEIGRGARTPGRDFAISAAGPLASLLIAALGYVVTRALPSDTILGLVAWQLMVTNLILGIFNSLPGLPLDGGRMLSAAVWKLTGNSYIGSVSAAWSGRVLAVAVAGLSLWAAQRSGNPSLLFFDVMIAFFIWNGATQALRSERLLHRIARLDAGSLTRRAITVRDDVPLSEALRLMAEAAASGLVVTDRDGRASGVVSRSAVDAVPTERRPWVPVSSVSRTLVDAARLPKDLAGQELLEAMSDTSTTDYLVVDANGALFGVLSAQDVERALAATEQGR